MPSPESSSLGMGTPAGLPHAIPVGLVPGLTLTVSYHGRMALESDGSQGGGGALALPPVKGSSPLGAAAHFSICLFLPTAS